MIFEKRFKIIRKLTKGSFGHVYEGVDIDQNMKKIICKINDDKEMNITEGNVMKLLNQRQYRNFPQLLAMGVQNDKSYQIMERFGHTLEFY